MADFFAELSKLLLMFMAGLQIELAQLRPLRRRRTGFALLTTLLPLASGGGVALGLGYGWLPAVVVGAPIASHTLIGTPIVMRLGATRLEPVVVAVCSTLLSDALALLVLAACVSAFAGGFSWAQLAGHLLAMALFVPLLLLGKRLAAQAAGRAFGYSQDARLTVWSLTMPQIAATLAAALVAFQTSDSAGQRLLDQNMQYAVLVMLVVSSVLGLLLTQRYAPRLLGGAEAAFPAGA